MSHYICPSCGHRDDIFSSGGAKKAAGELDADVLGEIPLDIRIRETSDEGTPIVIAEPDSAYSKAYLEIAQRLIEKVSTGVKKAAPNISMGG